MNPIHTFRLLTIFLGATCLASAGCTEKSKAPETKPPVTGEVGTVLPTTGADAITPPVAATTTTPDLPDVPAVTWPDLKEQPFAMRERVIAGLKDLEATVDRQVAELMSRRAAMPPSTNTMNWELAMKEMQNARMYLEAMGEELEEATAETWNEQKEKIGLAWERTQDAYRAVLASTTN